MAEETPKFDPKLEEGIAYFEKMLQLMPDDRTTLEFLCVAYEQIGEKEKQRKALCSLAGVLIKEKDLESADRIAERLAEYHTPDAQAAVLRVRAAHAQTAPRPSPAQATVAAEPAAAHAAPSETPAAAAAPSRDAYVHIALKAQGELINLLAQRHVIDEGFVPTLRQRLAELAEAPGCFLISALAILEKENTAIAENVAAYLADTAGTPPIPLEAFDLQGEFPRMLPELMVRIRGVMPFAKLGDTLLVAVLDPLDTTLKQEIETALNQPCRFYLAHPRTMEEILDKLFADKQPAADGNAEGTGQGAA
ncbi:MAG: hypothetical protein MJ240_02350 [Kiritimatiellae bacterium]|nr:hypothetical protein [Kiritimatiellia bacterium]